MESNTPWMTLTFGLAVGILGSKYVQHSDEGGDQQLVSLRLTLAEHKILMIYSAIMTACFWSQFHY